MARAVAAAVAGRHHVEIEIGHQAENRQHLIQHFAVLRRHANRDVEVAVVAQLTDYAREFDGFGTRPEHEQDLAGRQSFRASINKKRCSAGRCAGGIDLLNRCRAGTRPFQAVVVIQ